MKNSPEAIEQSALIEWAELMKPQIPEIGLIFHIPNEGKRSPRSGAEQKRMGLKRGVPDLFLPVAANGHHGLFIEMKAGNNKPTKAQEIYLNSLADQGYSCIVCWSWEVAAYCICNYLHVKCPELFYRTNQNHSRSRYIRYIGNGE